MLARRLCFIILQAEYQLGFFAAITVETSDVTLDMNGKSLQQSDEHALMQRFFSLIELGNSPFLAGEGINMLCLLLRIRLVKCFVCVCVCVCVCACFPC